MTRKDYVKFAGAFRNALDLSQQRDLLVNHAVRDIADTMADICEADNPRFDRARFFTACGMGG
jgi:hypothetical protein